MNPLYKSMNNSSVNNSMNQLKSIFAASKNPIMLFGQIAQNNPQLRPIVQELQSGRSPQEILMNECQKRGIDYNQFINSLK